MKISDIQDGICVNFKVISVRKGSTVVTLEMSRRQAERLLAAYRCGELAEHGVIGCTLLTGSDRQLFWVPLA